APDATICDAGCGLGYLSAALAPHVKHITCVDINPRAIHFAQKMCHEKGLANVTSLCADMCQCQDMFDNIIFCLYGSIEEAVTISRRCCRGKVVVIKRNYTEHRFSMLPRQRLLDHYASSADYLTAQGIKFAQCSFSLRMGQPFRSLEEAKHFFELYSHVDDPALITDTFVQNKLIPIRHGDYQYYMPHDRQLGLLVWDAQEGNRHA
ncbi:MAG: class I SAM-dependent methyltransferase, partial [Clostridia bacterium]|nr:class I SAM-dependent methyltransferase [Clostridia bacterium]